MHTDIRSSWGLEAVLEAVAGMNDRELDRLQDAMDRRRADGRRSVVVERRGHGSGVLQLEYRRNPRTGTERGPYWFYKYRENGRQRTEYVGKDLAVWMTRREKGQAHG